MLLFTVTLPPSALIVPEVVKPSSVKLPDFKLTVPVISSLLFNVTLESALFIFIVPLIVAATVSAIVVLPLRFVVPATETFPLAAAISPLVVKPFNANVPAFKLSLPALAIVSLLFNTILEAEFSTFKLPLICTAASASIVVLPFKSILVLTTTEPPVAEISPVVVLKLPSKVNLPACKSTLPPSIESPELNTTFVLAFELLIAKVPFTVVFTAPLIVVTPLSVVLPLTIKFPASALIVPEVVKSSSVKLPDFKLTVRK